MFKKRKVEASASKKSEDVKDEVAVSEEHVEISKPDDETEPGKHRTFPNKRKWNETDRAENKVQKKNIKMKNWRLIIRNLPFKCSEGDLREALGSYGTIIEIMLPKSQKDPKRGAGFGFVQFSEFQAATAAFKAANMKPIRGRVVALDWAVPKDTYLTAVLTPKTDSAKSSEVIKTEKIEEEETSENSDKESNDQSESEEEEEIKEKRPRKQMIKDEAIEEGRKLFVRNLSFDSSRDELKDCFSKFGNVTSAFVCKYAGTDHSKGSGFVEFESKSETEKCLEAASEESQSGINLHGRRLIVCQALGRNQVADIEKARKDKKGKDQRNLHLLRVGLVRPGTAEANDMSDFDGKRRAALELASRQKIRNLHVFVSAERLTVHNLPTTVDDAQLRRICISSVDDRRARITECRIWRDRNRLNASGVGKSRGYGFVAFSEHKHALACLNALNNNPETFGDAKRPIVQFALEDKVALNKKAKRYENAKANQLSGKNSDRRIQERPVKSNEFPATTDLDLTKSQLKQGGRKAMPSHLGPKIRHKRRPTDAALTKKKPKNKKSRSQARAEKNKVNIAPRGTGETRSERRKKRARLTKYLTLS